MSFREKAKVIKLKKAKCRNVHTYIHTYIHTNIHTYIHVKNAEGKLVPDFFFFRKNSKQVACTLVLIYFDSP